MSDEQPQVPAKRWLKRVLIGDNPSFTMVRIVFWVAACLLIYKFVLVPVKVHGISMMPTYKEGSVNLIYRLAYASHEPRRGDVVAIKLAGESVMYLKRIIALPGETLEFRGGKAFIDGQPLSEPYVKYPCNWEHPPEAIGPQEYYVVGDNRSMDFEEHTQGKAWRNQILGRTLL